MEMGASVLAVRSTPARTSDRRLSVLPLQFTSIRPPPSEKWSVAPPELAACSEATIRAPGDTSTAPRISSVSATTVAPSWRMRVGDNAVPLVSSPGSNRQPAPNSTLAPEPTITGQALQQEPAAQDKSSPSPRASRQSTELKPSTQRASGTMPTPHSCFEPPRPLISYISTGVHASPAGTIPDKQAGVVVPSQPLR